jgi:hypothetical protein
MRFAKISYGNHNQVGLIDKEINLFFLSPIDNPPLSFLELKGQQS